MGLSSDSGQFLSSGKAWFSVKVMLGTLWECGGWEDVRFKERLTKCSVQSMIFIQVLWASAMMQGLSRRDPGKAVWMNEGRRFWITGLNIGLWSFR